MPEDGLQQTTEARGVGMLHWVERPARARIRNATPWQLGNEPLPEGRESGSLAASFAADG